jgi:hypothetical protein
MKSVNRLARGVGIIGVLAAFSIALLGAGRDEANAESTVGEVVIADVLPKGRYVVHSEVLRTTFTEGGDILAFSIREFPDGSFLVRQGTTATGQTRTDTIPLVRIGGHLYVQEIIRHIMVCIGGCTFCGVLADHSGCKCPNGSACETGWIDIYGLTDITL